MIRRTSNESGRDERGQLCEALRGGVEAMNDPAVEARVKEYFLKNPTFSLDMIHVAAVACRVRDELTEAEKVRVPMPTKKTISHWH